MKNPWHQTMARLIPYGKQKVGWKNEGGASTKA